MTEAPHLPLILVILDGWGIAPAWGGNAISMAKTPAMNDFWKAMPHTSLNAAAEAVGLPKGVMGNSEVGHLNIGAGKVVKQFLPLIDEQIQNRQFFKNPVLLNVMNQVKEKGTTLHLVGIISDGGVHGHLNHLYALLEMVKMVGVEQVLIHAITDGRDAEPTSAMQYVHQLESTMKTMHSEARIATVTGRYYAMDRDNRWERTSKAFEAIVYGKGQAFADAKEAVAQNYKNGVLDEFMIPAVIRDAHEQVTPMKDGDGVIFYNFRSDRMRQLVKAVTGQDAGCDLGPHLPRVVVVTFTEYQAGLPVEVAFQPEKVEKSLAEVVAEQGLRQFHVAETEKYAHVTYFFNGGIEAPVAGETRLLIPSPKVATYNQAPKMSAEQIMTAVIERLQRKDADFIVVNFANADMVGHTGDIRATIMGVETIDNCLAKIWREIESVHGILIITADHGNAEQKINPDTGLPDTEHTKNPVPFMIISDDPEIQRLKLAEGGCLGNVAPTVLELMGIEKPTTMTLDSLIVH